MGSARSGHGQCEKSPKDNLLNNVRIVKAYMKINVNANGFRVYAWCRKSIALFP